ncbi:hypothetical protein QVD17_39419 [Tagetes erecta]|uniref:Uncharacterized protein n=1 Tax=Tagetes erecta TaxID=13708 RepID=A0AAD8NG75_TARER|nr:hypothetical protein QVD17_39419 [Tagetes erecta]
MNVSDEAESLHNEEVDDNLMFDVDVLDDTIIEAVHTVVQIQQEAKINVLEIAHVLVLKIKTGEEKVEEGPRLGYWKRKDCSEIEADQNSSK